MAFFRHSDEDRVNFRQFVRVLAHFRPLKKSRANALNSREGKLKFAFKLYDLDDDDRITKEELLAVLQMMVGENIRLIKNSHDALINHFPLFYHFINSSEDQLMSIAERTILEADSDGDGMIGFEEFCKVLGKLNTTFNLFENYERVYFHHL